MYHLNNIKFSDNVNYPTTDHIIDNVQFEEKANFATIDDVSEVRYNGGATYTTLGLLDNVKYTKITFNLANGHVTNVKYDGKSTYPSSIHVTEMKYKEDAKDPTRGDSDHGEDTERAVKNLINHSEQTAVNDNTSTGQDIHNHDDTASRNGGFFKYTPTSPTLHEPVFYQKIFVTPSYRNKISI